MPEKEQSEVRSVILDSISEGVFTVDLDWRITSFNRAAEGITGIPQEKAIGQHCRDVLWADVCEIDCTPQQTMQTGKIIGRVETFRYMTMIEQLRKEIQAGIRPDEHEPFEAYIEKLIKDMSKLEHLRIEVLK